MPRQQYALENPAVINGKTFARGAIAATIETPDGFDIDRALNAIVKGLAHPIATAQSPAPEVIPPKTILPAIGK